MDCERVHDWAVSYKLLLGIVRGSVRKKTSIHYRYGLDDSLLRRLRGINVVRVSPHMEVREVARRMLDFFIKR